MLHTATVAAYASFVPAIDSADVATDVAVEAGCRSSRWFGGRICRIYDDRVGLGRTYAKLAQLTFDNWLSAIRNGRSYVSDGRSHLMDFAADGVEVGTRDVTSRDGRVHVTLNAAALLDEMPNTEIAGRNADQKPFWDIERARAGTSPQRDDRVPRQRTARRDAHADG